MKNRLLQIFLTFTLAFAAHQAMAECKDISSQRGDRRIIFVNDTAYSDHANLTFKRLAPGGREGNWRITVHKGGIMNCNKQYWDSTKEEVTDVDWAKGCHRLSDVLSGSTFKNAVGGESQVFIVKEGAGNKHCTIR